MRRLVVLLIVVTFGSFSIGILPVLAQEEGWVDEAWDGVDITLDAAPDEPLNAFLGETGSLRERIVTGHVITFTNPEEPPSAEKAHAHVPEIPDAEFMAVYVQQGEFAFDVMPPTSFIVDPAGAREITVLEIEDPEDVFEAYYSLPEDTSEILRDALGEPCTEMCTLPQPSGIPELNAAPERTAIQLLTGDWILAPAGGLCVWCLLNTWAETGTTGVLYVYPLSVEPFTWAAARDAFGAATPEARIGNSHLTGAVSTDPLTHAAGWAFFSPAPNCRSG